MSTGQLQARDLLINIDRSRRATLGRQLEAELRIAIRGGRLSQGSELPSTRALAEDLGVSRGVVVRAYAQLAAEGYLEVRQGANPKVREIDGGPTLRKVARRAGPPKPRFDLQTHQPDLNVFPRHTWLRSLRLALSTALNEDLGYISPLGHPQLRTEVAHYLSRARGVEADPDRVVITAGCTHTLSLVCRALVRRGQNAIGFENPSHWLLRSVAEQAGLASAGIPVDQDGIDVDLLQVASVDAVVVTPAHQFPTGVALSADRRAGLVNWARGSERLIIEDDYDAEFRYDRTPIGALQGLLPERIVYMGSTNKTLSPGIRLGWAVLPTELVSPVAEELFRSVLHLSGIDQLALADFVGRGEFDRHLRRMRTVYRRRRDLLVRALEQHLPELPIGGIAAGLHIVVGLESATEEKMVRDKANARGLEIESLGLHTLPGYNGPAGLLIGYARLAEPTIVLVVEQLADVIQAARSSNHASQ